LIGSNTAEVDVIVLDWDGGEMLSSCLQSIDAQTLRPKRVIIFDNGSRQAVSQRLPKTNVPITVLRSPENIGFTGGINKAMAEVKTPFVAWVNNDVVLSARWLERLLPAMGEQTIGAAQTINLREKNVVDGAGIGIEHGLYRQIGHGERIDKLKQIPQPWGVSATATLYRVKALKDSAVSGSILRPEFFAYYEDVELCARLRQRGWRFRLVPEPLVFHRGSSSGGRLGWEAIRLRTRNRYRVARIHKGVGQISSFLAEDLRLAGKDLVRGQVQFAFRRIGSIFDGLMG
jgi:GT2 family glycosyltransferase